MSYGFTHEGKMYTSDGEMPVTTTAETTAQHNRVVEANEIQWLKSWPEKLFLYVMIPRDGQVYSFTSFSQSLMLSVGITTWLGTVVSTSCYIGPRKPVGGIAGRYAYKRAIDCRIYGCRYVGWFYESAGDYCRLRKAKVQR